MNRLRTPRGTVRAALTSTITQIRELLQQPSIPATDIQAHLNYLTERKSPLQELFRQILDAVDDDGLDDELAATEEYQRNVSFMTTRANSSLTTPIARHQEVAGSSYAAGLSTTPAESLSCREHLHTVARPRLQFLTFSGMLRDWTGFWDHFNTTIRLNNALPPMEKFKYLLRYLTDRAKQAVEEINQAFGR